MRGPTGHERGAARRQTLWLAAAAIAAVALSAAWWIRLPVLEPRDASPAPDVGMATEPAVHAAVARRIADDDDDDVTTPPVAPRRAPTFDQYVDRLVALAEELREAVHSQSMERAHAIDDESRALVVSLERDHPDCGDLSLFALGALPPREGDEPGLRFSSLHFLLGRALARIEADVPHTGRARLDALVGKVLDLVPRDAPTARALEPLVTAGARLGLVHEDPVLEIVALVAEEPWLAPVAKSLLRHLWDNLEQQGIRTGSELAALALLFKDDTNPSRRIAAFETLLTVAGGRYRELVLHDIAARGDRDAALAVLQLAADSLPVDEAMDALHRLGGLAEGDLLGPCLTLAERGGAQVQSAYEELLASGTDPGLRAELVSGLGIAGSADGIQVARLAFDQDPDPLVRERALFALTASAPTSHGILAWEAARADTRNRSPRGAGTLVLALENLASVRDGELRQRVAHWARDLQQMDWLGGADRERLDQILAKAEPR